MKRKFLSIFIVLLSSISILAGCKKVISTTDETVKVEIVNSYHKDRIPKITYDSSTDKPRISYYPEENYVYVEYDGIEYTFEGASYYRKYGNRIGAKVAATLRTTKYEDGSTKVQIINLK